MRELDSGCRAAASPAVAAAGLVTYLIVYELPQPRLKLIGKPQRPSSREIALNPRARSAMLRVAERTHG